MLTFKTNKIKCIRKSHTSLSNSFHAVVSIVLVLPMFLASATVSGRFVLNVSGRNRTNDPDNTEIPPNSITGSEGIRRACKANTIHSSTPSLTSVIIFLSKQFVVLNVRTKERTLTSKGVCGAVMDPT